MLNPAGKENKGDTVSDFVRRTNNEPCHCKGAPRRGHGRQVLRLARGGHEMMWQWSPDDTAGRELERPHDSVGLRGLVSMGLSDYGLLLETMKGSWKNGKGGWKTQR